MVVLRFAPELHHLHNVEVPAKKHEPVDCHVVESLRNVIESGNSSVLILNCESGVVLKQDVELPFVEVDHF